MSAFPFDPSFYHPNYRRPTTRVPSSAETIADPPTVLVVDDDPMARYLETQILRLQGYAVLEAEGAAEAMRLARAAATIDLLLTDFVMPEVDGLELARQFRAVRPGTPVLMVSGSLPTIPDKVKELDRFALLEKTSTLDELLGKVHSLLTEVAPLPLRTS